ncbi:hypothetical protein ACJIZ3_008575 [Penstemon smallii]|uniref:Uncharacterized protein n=1 Tax=Penstemon smallii TaxID=265156 RepID=A0ABD3TA80_9LAMI
MLVVAVRCRSTLVVAVRCKSILVVVVSCMSTLVAAVSCRCTLVVVVTCKSMLVVAESCKSTLVVVVATCRNILDALRALGEVVTCSSTVVGVNCTSTFLLAEEGLWAATLVAMMQNARAYINKDMKVRHIRPFYQCSVSYSSLLNKYINFQGRIRYEKFKRDEHVTLH